MAQTMVHPDALGLKKFLVWSVALHLLLAAAALVSSLFSSRGDSWGGPGAGGNSVTVGLVARLPGVALPRPEAVTTSRVVDLSKGLYKSEPPPPPPEAVDPKTTPIPEFTKEKAPRYVTRPSKVLEDKTIPPDNAVPYGGGGAPALPYSQFTMSGQTQGGMGFSGPGGGDFTGRFPAYVEAVRNRISSNWLQSTVDPSVRWAPRAMFTFQILRDGTVTNIQMTKTSGNRSVDSSALRALQASNPLSPLPSGYSGNIVTVEFWFEFRR